MKKLVFLLSATLFFCLPVLAQEPAKSIDEVKPSTTRLTAEESKQLKAAFELAGQAETEAKAAQDRAAARNAEAKALYWQFIVLKKIDIDKWQFAGFNETGIAVWVEKKQEVKDEKKSEN